VVNIGLLTAEIGSGVLGTPANFNGLRVLASLLRRRRSTEVNQSLHMFGRLLGCYILYTFLGLLHCNGILPGAKLCPIVSKEPEVVASVYMKNLSM